MIDTPFEFQIAKNMFKIFNRDQEFDCSSNLKSVCA